MKALSKYIFLFLIVLIGLFFPKIFNFYENIIFNNNIIALFISLISGLFGFTVAVIPFAIQLFNQDNTNKKNDFLNKLMQKDKFDFFVKPMFNRFIKLLNIMFYLFLYVILLSFFVANKNNLKEILFLNEMFLNIPIYKFGVIALFYLYLILIIKFLKMLKNIIRDLQTLVFNFFKSRENNDNDKNRQPHPKNGS